MPLAQILQFGILNAYVLFVTTQKLYITSKIIVMVLSLIVN